jgi:hypothetical protein
LLKQDCAGAAMKHSSLIVLKVNQTDDVWLFRKRAYSSDRISHGRSGQV